MEDSKNKNIWKKILYSLSVIVRTGLLAFLGFIGFFVIFISTVYMAGLWIASGIALTVLFVAALFVAFFPRNQIKKKLFILGIVFGITAFFLIVKTFKVKRLLTRFGTRFVKPKTNMNL